jgi:flagellar hook-associated protein 1 FlgK
VKAGFGRRDEAGGTGAPAIIALQRNFGMGLSAVLNNALSGLTTNQSSLEVVSRNVANSGTPGYHAESMNVIGQAGPNSNYAIATQVTRAFDKSLQLSYNNETSDSAYAAVTAKYLGQLQTALGTPDGVSSLNTVYNNFETALSALTASPDDYSTRASVVTSAQALATTLNGLTTQIQGLRQQANQQIGTDVATVNQALSSLASVNRQLASVTLDPTTRAQLQDRRDTLVAQVAGNLDVNASYAADGRVTLTTRSGVTLVDQQAAAQLGFAGNANIGAAQQFSSDDSKNGVGTLVLKTPAGLQIDLVKQDVLQSGELAGLIDLRDNTLVQVQAQLDTIAGGLAQSFSTNVVAGTTVPPPGPIAPPAGTPTGMSVDISQVQPGNTVSLTCSVGGVSKSVSVVDVTDASKLPMDYTRPNGMRVVGIDFSGGAASVAGQLQALLGSSFQISGSGSTLTVLNDGSANSAVSNLTAATTSTAAQDGSLGLNLFVDTGNVPYTGSLDGLGQQLGFAGRISVSGAVIANNALLVQSTTATPIGDVDRVNYLYNQLTNAAYADAPVATSGLGGSLTGTVGQLISQTMTYQGNQAAAADSASSSHADAMTALNSRMGAEYGVDVNGEMARLVQLQAAYAANARVVSAVQAMLSALGQAVGIG